MIHTVPYGAIPPTAAVVYSIAAYVVNIDQIGQIVLAGIVTVGAIVSYLQARKAKNKVQEIHVLVNSQKEELEDRIEQLEAKLELKRGEEIPAQQIVTPATDPAV